MNIYTGMLFLQGFLTDVHELDDQGRAFARGYGNRAASEQAFPALGRAQPAPRTETTAAPDLCPTGACG